MPRSGQRGTGGRPAACRAAHGRRSVGARQGVREVRRARVRLGPAGARRRRRWPRRSPRRCSSSCGSTPSGSTRPAAACARGSGVLAHRRSVDRVRAEVRRSPRRGTARAGQARPPRRARRSTRSCRGRGSPSCVRDALDQLPAEQRDAVVLAYFGGRTYREVATELAIPEGTAKSRLRLGLAKLDDLLRPSLIDQEATAWT